MRGHRDLDPDQLTGHIETVSPSLAGRCGCLLLCGWALLANCTPENPWPRVSERDSLGVRIVESSSPRWDESEGWSVREAPLLDLAAAGTGEPYEFHRVRDAIRLTDGTLAVATPTEIRFFSESGAFLESVGREGEGPGEFTRLSDIDELAGDSLLAFDYWLRRGTVLAPDREVVRVFTLGLDFVHRDLAPIGDAHLLVMTSWPSALIKEGEAGLVRMPVPVVRLSTTGEVVDTVAMAAGSESVRIPMEGGFADAAPMFGRDSHFAVRDDRVLLGSAERMEYRVLGADGKLLRIHRVPGYDLRLTEARLEAERDARLDVNPANREILEKLPLPERRPAYSVLLVDATGAVWLEEHVGEFVDLLSFEPREWQVFDPAGEWLGAVRLPGRFTVHEIGADYVLGVRRDELDVERPQVLRLEREG